MTPNETELVEQVVAAPNELEQVLDQARETRRQVLDLRAHLKREVGLIRGDVEFMRKALSAFALNERATFQKVIDVVESNLGSEKPRTVIGSQVFLPGPALDLPFDRDRADRIEYLFAEGSEEDEQREVTGLRVVYTDGTEQLVGAEAITPEVVVYLKYCR